MCRLLGVIANKEVDLRFSLYEGPKTLRDLSKENEDGWGLGWYRGGSPKVVKEPRQAAESRGYRRTSAEARSRIFVAHVRKATKGSRTMENCHPFKWNQWLFAHNGSVDVEALFELLNEEHRNAIHGETDSEVYFHWILQNVEQKGDVVHGIRVALREARKVRHTGLNFLLTDGEKLYAYREASQSYNYYSLYSLSRDSRQPGPVSFESKVGALLESKSLNNERAVLVCSEKLTQEEWLEIPLRHLLVISSNLKTNLIEMD
ncbi:MAG: class II glutamine amidotransferase [Thermodesulforhabdaceae bacterium]|jgi:glutamine amidotransferase